MVGLVLGWRFLSGWLFRERTARLRAEYTVRELEQRIAAASDAHAKMLHDLRSTAGAVGPILENWESVGLGADDTDVVRMILERVRMLATSTWPRPPVSGASADDRERIERIVRRAVAIQGRATRISVAIEGIPALPTDADSDLDRLIDNLLSNAVRASSGLTGVLLTVDEWGITLQNRTRDTAKAEQCMRERRSGSGSSGLGMGIAADMAKRLGWAVRWDVAHAEQIVTVRAGPASDSAEPGSLTVEAH